ncbi:flagellar filament capping protein FliD [Thalassospira marina]|uniref:Flagellar hook-associated protein 2 n=1 Tax=Thalassospira marina TaxID=2048283 RepID=A0A2N3KZL9_9PROT|nr:flagellar filament capping protein FliD [Thalassospira marina]PKR55920.1 flagellar hook protein FliD [Thalassospira marina]
MSGVNLNNVYVGDNGRIQLSGLSSNIDFVDVVDQMMKARRIPADNLQKRIDSNDEKLTALRELQDLVKDLQSSISNLYGAASFDKSKNTFASKQVFTNSADGNAANLMSVSANNSASTGSYKFEISQIASKHKIGAETVNVNPDDDLSTATNGSGTAIGTGTFTVGTAKGSIQIDVTATDSLKDIRDKINSTTSTSGVQASVVKVADGQSTIILTSTEEGSTNRMTLSDDSGNVLQNLGILVDDGAGGTQINSAQEIDAGNDAQFTMDGVSITRSSNDIDDLVDGLSISLYDAEPGMTINVEVEQDLSAAKNAIVGFVDAYNAVKSYINEKTYVDPQTNEAGDDSVLLGNSAVKSIETSLQQIVGSTPFRSTSQDSDLAVLAQIGISLTSAASTGGSEDTKYSAGTLEIDETKLNDMLINNVDEVAELFNFNAVSNNASFNMTSFTGNTGAGSYEFSVTKDASGTITSATYTLNGETKNATINGNSLSTADGMKIFYNGAAGATETATINTSVGLGARLQFALQDMLDAEDGSLPQEIQSVETQNTTFEDKIDRIDSRIANQREVMMNKFINMEQSLAQIKTVQNSLDELMAAGKSDN